MSPEAPPPIRQPEDGELLRLLDLDPVGTDIFRNRHSQPNFNNNLFGGQVLGQALRSAMLTVPEGRPPNSLHSYFLRPGSVDRPVDFEVERLRDGRSFSQRRVTAKQDGKAIFELSASFHAPEPSDRHQTAMPDNIPAPETLLSLAQWGHLWRDKITDSGRQGLVNYPTIDLRPVAPDELIALKATEPKANFWIRAVGAETDNVDLRPCILAFLSDYWLIASGRIIHRVPVDVSGLHLTSLDHCLWFHEPTDPSEWHLFVTESPWAGNGRGLSRGGLYRQDGTLVASVAQEFLSRTL